jgi:hypothetical protein
MSQSHISTPPGRKRPARESVTTAAGIAAERVALADRERERRTARVRSAARRLDRRAVDAKL